MKVHIFTIAKRLSLGNRPHHAALARRKRAAIGIPAVQHLVKRPADEFHQRVAKNPLGFRVRHPGRTIHASQHDAVAALLGDPRIEAELILEPVERLRSLGAGLGVAQFALDGRSQPRQIVLHQIIVSARLHHCHGAFFAHGTRYHQKWNVFLSFLHDGERVGRVETRYIVVAENQVPRRFRQRFTQGKFRLDASVPD